MKTNFLLSAALSASLFFTSCGSDDATTIAPDAPIVGVIETLSGDITGNKTLVRGTYALEGILKVKSGGVLTIPAGVTIIAQTQVGGLDYIFVENGGRIMAEGTTSDPIILTASERNRGEWGGLVMIGDAPVKGNAGSTNPVGEFGTTDTYGGSNATHSSGVLRNVQVLYAGATIPGSTTAEFNNFSFYALGSGTILENLVAANGTDDGFEFYGGTASLVNAIVFSCGDDSFDWQDGWKGKDNENWFAYQQTVGNYGMEIEAKNNDNTLANSPTVTGITLIRRPGTIPEAGDAQYDAIQFKARGNGEYSNIRVKGYANSLAGVIRIQDANTALELDGGDILVSDVNIKSGETTTLHRPAGSVTYTDPTVAPIRFTTNASAAGASLTAGAWAIVEGTDLVALMNTF